MRALNRVSRLFLAGGMLAGALLLSSCGNYALYKIRVTTSLTSPIVAPDATPGTKTSDRTNIEQCKMTITDENGDTVLENFPLPACHGGTTPADLGLLSYSTSRTSGTLTFQVDGWSNAASKTGLPIILQTGKSAAVAPQAYPPEMPQINIAMQ
jgi:hypothetical protein